MTVTVHNPDQYMMELRTIVAQGRKRLGFLIGAGAAAGLKKPGTEDPLIPAIKQLTQIVLEDIPEEFAPAITAILDKDADANIEAILSRVRTLSRVLDNDEVAGLNGEGYGKLSEEICIRIGKAVNVRLPLGETPFRHLVNWITGTDRDHPIEIFTTNYDLLFEEAMESSQAPFFDGFAGAREPFFDGVAVEHNDLPARWTRLWKLHGSIGWKAGENQETIRTGETSATHLIFPEHQKYDQTQKAPYVALFDRLQAFLRTPDTLLIASGFSFFDTHVSAKVDEALAANPTASVFAFQYGSLAHHDAAARIASRRPNFSVYASDKAIINGVTGDWRPGDPPSRDWAPIRSSYWGSGAEEVSRFLLGEFSALAQFLALSKSGQAYQNLDDLLPNQEEEAT
ncbi:MAG: SIR2 family protein [Henriciella sp.]|nr:SIR2 family protein [Henriciella sp.]MBO6696089.1 SIR2 family protein [Henriciella sp.]